MIYNQIWCSNERKDRQTDRGKTVYPPPPSGSGGIKTIIWPWGQRSRSLWYVVKGHYGMRHTTLWSCTHIPNIIDRSGKIKKLWSGQVSLRRSGRKNQTKTMSPFIRRGDIIINIYLSSHRSINNTGYLTLSLIYAEDILSKTFWK